MNKYISEGITYTVAPGRLEEFMKKHPFAKKVEDGTAVADSTMGVSLQGPSLTPVQTQQDLGAAGNWFMDAWTAGEINADMYDDASNVYDIGNADEARELSDQELNMYINLVNKSGMAAGQMKEAQAFAKSYNKYDELLKASGEYNKLERMFM